VFFAVVLMIFFVTARAYGGECDCDQNLPDVPGPDPSSRGLQTLEWLTESGDELDRWLGNGLSGPPDCFPCTENAPDGSIDFVISIDQPLVVANVFLVLSTWDVDYNGAHLCTGKPETNKVYINGHYLGTLTGANNSWSINAFAVPIRHVNAPGDNAVKVAIDTANAALGYGLWCVRVDWGKITVAGESSENVSIGNSCQAYGTDIDNDGLYDSLNFDVSVTALFEGDINLNGALYGGSNNLIAWASTQKHFFPPGTYTMTLTFDAEMLNCRGEDGPFVLREVTAYDIDRPEKRAFRSQLCTTPAFNISHFKTCTTSWELKSPWLPPMKYWIVSVPLRPDNPDPLAVFGAAFGGVYDRTVWRLFWRDPATGTNKEYPNVPQVAPGIAYWIASRYGPALDATGTLVTDETFPIPVPPGWVQLGNPYYGTVNKSDLMVTIPGTGTSVPLSDPSSPIKDELWGTANGAFYQTDKLLRWRGYFIRNTSGDTVTLIIPNPLLASAASSLQSVVSEASNRNPGEKVNPTDMSIQNLSNRQIQDNLPLPPTIPGGSGGIVIGMVTDADTSGAISDASVYFDPLGEYPCIDGKYLIASIPAGLYSVSGYRQGYQFALKAGVSVTSGGSITEDFSLKPIAPINITMVEVTCNAPTQVSSPRTIRVLTDSTSTVYYQFWARSGYGTADYATSTWTILKAYSTDNTYTWNPTDEGHYVLMVWVTDDTTSHAPQMGGFTLPVGMSSDVLVVRLTSDVTQGITPSTPITLTTDTFGSVSGSPYFVSYVRSGYGIPTVLQSGWDIVGSGYSINNYVEWTPLNGGSYIVMTHVKDDLSSQDFPEMAGMTCFIQE